MCISKPYIRASLKVHVYTHSQPAWITWPRIYPVLSTVAEGVSQHYRNMLWGTLQYPCVVPRWCCSGARCYQPRSGAVWVQDRGTMPSYVLILMCETRCTYFVLVSVKLGALTLCLWHCSKAAPVPATAPCQVSCLISASWSPAQAYRQTAVTHPTSRGPQRMTASPPSRMMLWAPTLPVLTSDSSGALLHGALEGSARLETLPALLPIPAVSTSSLYDSLYDTCCLQPGP